NCRVLATKTISAGTQVGPVLLSASIQSRQGWSLPPGQADRSALRFCRGRLMPFAIFFIGDCFDASFSSRASFRWRVGPARELGKRQLSRTSPYRPASGCRVPGWRRNGSVFSARSDKKPAKSCTLRPSGAMTLPSLKALSLFPFKFLPSDSYEPFVNRVPQLVSLLLVQFFDFLFLNQMCPVVSEAIEHDLFGNGCAMPHGFGQLPVEFGS